MSKAEGSAARPASIRPGVRAIRQVTVSTGPVKAQTTRTRLAHPTADIITEINQVVRGWAGYFHVQHCDRAFSALRRFVSQRVRLYLRRKHQLQSWGYQAFPDTFLYGRLGLYRLPGAPSQAPASASR